MDIEMLSVKEASALLRIHPETLRRFAREGKINAYKIGRCKFIAAEEVKKFIQKCSCMNTRSQNI